MLGKRKPGQIDASGKSDPLVFPSLVGTLRDPTNVDHQLKQAFITAGFPQITSHILRKSVATAMDEAGLTARNAADQLGHARPSITQDVYFAVESPIPAPLRYSKLLAFNQGIPIPFIGTFPYAYGSQAKEGMMAQRIEVILEDDIDGSPAVETVRFAYDKTQYEIDLSSEHAQALRGALSAYIEHARKALATPRQTRGPRKHTDTSAVREWARAQGKEINERGRIPGSVMKEYEAAQGS